MRSVAERLRGFWRRFPFSRPRPPNRGLNVAPTFRNRDPPAHVTDAFGAVESERRISTVRRRAGRFFLAARSRWACRFRLRTITVAWLVPRFLAAPLLLFAVADGMDVIAAKARVGVFAACFERLARRRWRNEALAICADQVRSPRLPQRFANFKIIRRLEELHQRPLQFAVAQGFRHMHGLLREWVDAG